jgi:hypothetical protein
MTKLIKIVGPALAAAADTSNNRNGRAHSA